MKAEVCGLTIPQPAVELLLFTSPDLVTYAVSSSSLTHNVTVGEVMFNEPRFRRGGTSVRWLLSPKAAPEPKTVIVS